MRYEFEYSIKREAHRNSFITFIMFFIFFNIIAFIFNIFGNGIIQKEIIITLISLIITLVDVVVKKDKKNDPSFTAYLEINNENIEYVSKFYKFKLRWKNIIGFNEFETTKLEKHSLVKRFIKVNVISTRDEGQKITIINRALLFLVHEPTFYFPRDAKNGTDLLPVLNKKLLDINKLEQL